MHWDRLFEDLEVQLASEWESERAALNAETERLRIARLELRGRLRVLCASAAAATLGISDGRHIAVRLRALGADWVAAVPDEARTDSAARSMTLIPLHAVRSVRVDHGLLLGSLDEAAGGEPGLRERMTFGFVLRDLARRRVPVSVRDADGVEVHGTIDRAGADHFDLAQHDPGVARLAKAVRGFVLFPFSAVASIQTIGVGML